MIDFGVDVPNCIVCKDNTLFVEELEYGIKKSSGGLYIPADKFSSNGEFVHPRWAKVIFKADNIKDIDIGDWVLISYGRWSTSILAKMNNIDKEIWYINPESYTYIMGVSKNKPKSLEQYV